MSMDNRFLRPLRDAVRYVYLFLFTRGQDQITTQSGDLLRAEQSVQSDIYGAGLPVTITELPIGTADADAYLAADNSLGTVTQRIRLGDIPGLAPPQAHTHPSSAITGLATVATSGSYNDLSNQPAIPPAYTLPAATTTTLGGVIVGTGLGVASGTVSVTYGTASSTACQGNDSRLSDSRTPLSHTHGNITNAGAIGSTSGQIVVTTTGGVLTTAATISSASVSGLGTIATQNANSVAITGGSINGTTIGATTASTGAFTTVTTTGNVGIGTTTPVNKLDVVGNEARVVSRGGTTSGRSFVEAQASDYWSATSYTGTYLLQHGNTATGTTAGLTNAGLGQLVFQNVSAGFIDTNGAPLVLGTANAERMRIAANGNVGIGTANPTVRLDVAAVSTIASGAWAGGTDFVRLLAASGSAFSEQAIAFQEAGSNVGAKIGVKNIGNGAYDIVFANRDNSSLTSAFAERARIAATGNVGIGTAAPNSRLEVIPGGGQGINCINNGGAGTTNYAVMAQSAGVASANTGLYVNCFNASTNYGVRIVAPAAGANSWAIYSDATAQSYFAGNVGIGTANPTISSGVGLHLDGSTLRLGTARTPASSTATGNQGEICWDSSYLYVCVSTNNWRRILLSTF
jgi:hypothetical protein